MKSTHRLIAIAASLSLLSGALLGCAEQDSPEQREQAATDSNASSIAPKRGVALGMYYGDRSLTETNKDLGSTPAIHLSYFGWAAHWAEDPVLAADISRGQTTLVNWEPFDADFRSIVAGTYDAQLVEQAEAAARLAAPVLLDFAAEMNEEEGWGGHDPKLYVAAYRHIHDIFAAHAAHKIEWVWAPNNTDSAGAPPALAYYPGPAYVDWTGVDGYNWGTSDPGFDWQTFTGVFDDTYRMLDKLGKPIIVGETASAEQGGSKAAWIESIVPSLKSSYPDVKALVWFDVEKERDWRIRSSSTSAAAVRELAADPYIVPAAVVQRTPENRAVAVRDGASVLPGE